MNKYSKQIAKYFYGHFLHVHESERQQKRCKSVLAVLQEKMGLFFFLIYLTAAILILQLIFILILNI